MLPSATAIRPEISFEAVCGVVDLIEMPITLLDLDGRLLHLNPSYERLLGRTTGELRGHMVGEVLPGHGRLRRAQYQRGVALFGSLLEQGSARGIFPN